MASSQVRIRWLSYVLVEGPAEFGQLPAEEDILAFLGQIEWSTLKSLLVRQDFH